MIAVARAADTLQVDIGDGQGLLTVPDIKLPGGTTWTAQRIAGQNAVHVIFAKNGKSIATLWHGPHDIGDGNGGVFYIVDAPRAVLQQLRDQLGEANVAPLIQALRVKPALRAWCKAQGFSLVRNAANVPVTVMPPLVICGQSPIDLDGEDLDAAQELPDLL